MVLVEWAAFNRIIGRNSQKQKAKTDQLEYHQEPMEVSAFVNHHNMVRNYDSHDNWNTGIPVVVDIAIGSGHLSEWIHGNTEYDTAWNVGPDEEVAIGWV